ncbi:protein transporter, putative [Ricinus communis]|uniref:Protein transporter, putative n=2 Tax=Ricinus communis TaxID=3988 RepID=B9SPW4_RICCO|nr:protein transporter, putative [Ricinus communis]
MLMMSSTLSYSSSPPSLGHWKTPTCLQTTSPSLLSKRKAWTLRTPVSVSSSDNQTVTPSPATKDDAADTQLASDIVRRFYEGINDHDLASVEDLIAENCVYEDLIFPHPFVGRKAILEFFKKFIDSISKDLQFVIDDISTEDSLAVGVTWHLEWKGRPFPFSKGCSFYRLQVLNSKKQIIYGRDSVEPAIKPGEAALVIIRGLAWLLQRFPQLADQLK